MFKQNREQVKNEWVGQNWFKKKDVNEKKCVSCLKPGKRLTKKDKLQFFDKTGELKKYVFLDKKKVESVKKKMITEQIY